MRVRGDRRSGGLWRVATDDNVSVSKLCVVHRADGENIRDAHRKGRRAD